MKRRLLAACYGMCIVLSWLAVCVWERLLPLPLGALPMLALGCGMLSPWVGFVFMAAIVIVYFLIFWSLLGRWWGKRAGGISVMLVLVLDIAANVIFTAISWWYLLAAVLDATLLVLTLNLIFHNKI